MSSIAGCLRPVTRSIAGNFADADFHFTPLLHFTLYHFTLLFVFFLFFFVFKLAGAGVKVTCVRRFGVFADTL